MMKTVDRIRRSLDAHDIKYEIHTYNYTTCFCMKYSDECGDFLERISVTGSCVTYEKSYLTVEQAIGEVLWAHVS